MKHSSNDEFYTPAKLWMPGLEVIQKRQFDLDPFSYVGSPIALANFTKAENGLAQQWFGDCWVNPPFSRGNKGDALAKVLEQAESPSVSSIHLLIKADNRTKPTQELLKRSMAVCAIAGNTRFIGSEGLYQFGLYLFYFGKRTSAFIEAYRPLGQVLISV